MREKMKKSAKINPIPETCEYLRSFIDSRYMDYFEDMNELQPDKGYGRYYCSSEVTQHFRDIVHNLNESFKGVRIPEDFASHVSLLRLVENFKTFLIGKREGLIKKVNDYYTAKGESTPTPVVSAEKMTEEVIDAMIHAQKIASKELDSESVALGTTQTDETLLLALSRFDEYISAVTSKRRTGRKALATLPKDEYDVQAHLEAILAVLEDDVKPEEWTPKYLGGSSRVDFLLPRLETVIECKMTRKGLGSRDLGDQLLIDIGRYSKHKKCKKLIYFIYDPQKLVRSKKAFLAECIEASSPNVRVIPILCT